MEDTELVEATADGEERIVRILVHVPVGYDIRPVVGSKRKRGEDKNLMYKKIGRREDERNCDGVYRGHPSPPSASVLPLTYPQTLTHSHALILFFLSFSPLLPHTL